MELRRLGNSGTVVTAWCLGTMTFGSEADEATSFAIMDAYVAAGGNFLDTADVYSNGMSESIIGRWLKARPEAARQVVIATKARFPMGDGPNDIGLSRRHLGVALDESLKRRVIDEILGTTWRDTTKAWSLKADGSYSRIQPKEDEAPVRSQTRFIELARERARETEGLLGGLSSKAMPGPVRALDKLRRRGKKKKRNRNRGE